MEAIEGWQDELYKLARRCLFADLARTALALWSIVVGIGLWGKVGSCDKIEYLWPYLFWTWIILCLVAFLFEVRKANDIKALDDLRPHVKSTGSRRPGVRKG